jgi:thioredoxin-like negative regulator of GroEL
MIKKPLFSLVCLALLLQTFALYDNRALVQPIGSFQEYLKAAFESDFVQSFLFYREDCTNCEQVEATYYKFAENMEGLIRVYAVDCDVLWAIKEDREKFPGCDPSLDGALPHIMVLEPPTTKINPYTKQPMQPVEHRFEGSVSPKSLGDFAKKWMPAWRKKLATNTDLEEFLADKLIRNKVILFTSKDETSPLYKGATSEFRDRLDFAEVHENARDIVKKYKIDTFPTLMVLIGQEDDSWEKEIYTNELRMDKLRRFLNYYALKQKAVKPMDFAQEQAKPQPGQAKAAPAFKNENITAATYEPVIFDTEKLVLVHIYKKESVPVWDESVNKFQGLADYYSLDCSIAENEKYATEKLGVKSFPVMIVYPIGKARKRQTKYSFGRSATLPDMLQEVSDIIDYKTTALNLENTQHFITNSINSKKPVFILFYEGKDFSMSFRELSQLSKYSEKFQFANFRNANADVKQQFNLKQLPTLVVIFLKDPNNEDMDPKDNVQVAHFTGHYNWAELSNFMDQFIVSDEDVVDLKKVAEIKSDSDFQTYCVKRGQTCIIALMNGDKSDGVSIAHLQDSEALLKKVQQRFLTRPVSFMWVDAMCHTELVMQLDVSQDFLPTVVSYNPQKKSYSQLIGRFEYESLVTWLDKVLKAKVLTTDLKESLTIDSKDCAEEHQKIKDRYLASQEEGNELHDEILREILEEQAAKGDEDDFGGKKKNKKKNKNKKKGGADEL